MPAGFQEIIYLYTYTHIKKLLFMKKLFHLAFAIGFAGMCFTACAGYSAQDYVNDMKSLTEKTLKNASSYTEEDWKRVGEEYRSINEKGKKVLEDMTEDQRKELVCSASDFFRLLIVVAQICISSAFSHIFCLCLQKD